MNRKEFANAVIDSILSNRDGFNSLFEQGFKETPDELIVGLSDEQLYDFYTLCDDFMGVKMFIKEYKEWATTQPFSHYNNEGKVYELDGSVTDYKADYERVANYFVELEEDYCKLKAQLFQPNWDDAPEWANWLAQDVTGQWIWFGENPVASSIESYGRNINQENFAKISVKNWKETLQQRPKPPALTVEVGQIQKHKDVNTMLLDALIKLAKLGNGDEYGNSDGNMIARAAIAKATE